MGKPRDIGRERGSELQVIKFVVGRVISLMGGDCSQARMNLIRDTVGGGQFQDSLRDAANLWLALKVGKYLSTRTNAQCKDGKAWKVIGVDGELDVFLEMTTRSGAAPLKVYVTFPSKGACLFRLEDWADGARFGESGEVVRSGEKWRLQDPPSRPVSDPVPQYDDYESVPV